jgi:hypothetical protein
MPQAQDIITYSLQDLGELAPGETASTDDLNTGLVKLNQILASWSIQRLNIYAILRQEWNLSNGTQQYTIGAGGAFNGPRPVSIRQATFVTQSSGLRFPIQILTAEQWGSILEQGAAGPIVRKLYYDDNYPLATIYVTPAPNAGGNLELYTWEQITQLASLTTTFDMPPGYELALRYNLALALAPGYGRPIDPLLKDDADRALAALRGLNAPPHQGEAQEVQSEGAAAPVPGAESLSVPH